MFYVMDLKKFSNYTRLDHTVTNFIRNNIYIQCVPPNDLPIEISLEIMLTLKFRFFFFTRLAGTRTKSI